MLFQSLFSPCHNVSKLQDVLAPVLEGLWEGISRVMRTLNKDRTRYKHFCVYIYMHPAAYPKPETLNPMYN